MPEARLHVSKSLRICANSIQVIGWVQISIGLIGCVVLPILYGLGYFERWGTPIPNWVIVLELLLAPIYLARTLYMIHGATHLRAGTNYRAAITSAILAALGLLFPISPYEVPFGIWALVILLRKDTRAAFAEAN